MPEMKIPGPDHPITVTANPSRIQVSYNDHVIVDTRRALTLKEASYKPVIYVPREDADMAFFSRTAHSTHCPYKGDASYFTLDMDGRIAENAVWTYETPYPAMETIRDYLAFYPNQVEIREIGAAGSPDAVRDAILHTDDGAGSSQKDHWPATERPR
ncbi:MAG TPA: DUF427 domain-containing protein [Caulobacteraceae bacterium]|jgi:uncharacterized protein (DUF427 family)|nr:DUF427 domain-containing protein [Caulobacteraceae bacterium]